MTSDPPDLGKGLFGYRKSAVNQILADRDVMLRQAEGRVRAAESKVADLQTELTSMKDRNTRMDEQVERLRAQLEVLMANAQIAPAAVMPTAPAAAPAPAPAPEVPASTPEAPSSAPWESEPSAWEEDFGGSSEAAAFPFDPEPEGPGFDEFGDSAASFEGLDVPGGAPAHDVQDDLPPVFDVADESFGRVHEPASLFGSPVEEATSQDVASYDAPAAEGDQDPYAWTDPVPPAPEPMRKVDEMRYQPEDDSPAPTSSPAGEEDPYASMSYGFSLQPTQPDDAGAAEESAEMPVFRGFTDDAFDEPSPSEYLGQPSAADPPPVPEWPAAAAEPWEQTPEPAAEWSAPSPVEPPAPSPWEVPNEAPDMAWSSPPPSESVANAHPVADEPKPSVSSQASDITNRFLTEELKGILSAAEESAARILERARATSEHQIAQSNRLWREVQAELARFASWREQVEPIIRSVHAKVEGVRTQIEEVPERIRQALAPMADSISMIDSDLAELASASTPPLLLTPSGLDPESPVNDWAIGESDGSDQQDGRSDHGEGAGHLAG